MTDPITEAAAVEAFRLTWENFPDAMVLVRRDRTILARNAATVAQGAFGGLPVGEKCFKANALEGKDTCRACRANQALRDRKPIACEGEVGGHRIRGYWIPLAGSSELYIHGYTTLTPLA
jgi:hypothetical protein